MNEATVQEERPSDAFDARTFRQALGWFATGVTIITTICPDGTPVGVTANSFSSVSLDPPLVLFSLARKAFSLAAFQESGRFAVNVLSGEQALLSNRFATASSDKWRDVDFERGESGCPIIGGALASFDCTIHATCDGGDHLIIVGRVLRLRQALQGDPLLFCRGSYRHLAPISVEYERRDGPIPAPLSGLDPWFSG